MNKNENNGSCSQEDLKICLRETAKLWKRRVNALDAAICEELFLEYGFDRETVLYLLIFAQERGADTLNYLYPLADILKKSNVKNRTEAELILEKSFKRYMDILTYINWNKKVPSPAEKDKIDEILDTWHPTEDEIRSAGEITRRAKRPSLQYFEAVLRNRRQQDSEENPENLFEQIKESVREEAGLSDLAYNTWIRDLHTADISDSRMEIRIPGQDDRLLHFIEARYMGYFENACKKIGVNKEICLSMQA